MHGAVRLQLGKCTLDAAVRAGAGGAQHGMGQLPGIARGYKSMPWHGMCTPMLSAFRHGKCIQNCMQRTIGLEYNKEPMMMI